MLHINPEQIIITPVFATITCEPNWQWKRTEPIPNYDLVYVWKGEGQLVLNGKEFQLKRGSCFLFVPGDWVTATHNQQNPLVLTYIHFNLEKEPNHLPSSYRILHDHLTVETLLTRYIRLFFVETFAVELEAQLIIKQLMIQLLREEYQVDRQVENVSKTLLTTIREVANYVQQHPGERHTIDSLSSRANLSPRYFSRKFKEIMGESLRSYLIEARIKRAKHLLNYTGMTVTEVAEALGYTNLHFFSRQFKQYTGKSPSEFREAGTN
ncbi:helix-turn-helix domain-containing protein [Ornithinibacillus halotolerans]|uniref:AraC family transcriptional regulator n=1 Tax=Ornithinibacillus halotolerans TaxID=1274357 RepID=A0A916RUR6_9BACI|nr:AraC family transcriptional regulator [Ornithinibacillus halotolerans]GGA71386.1 AraC family transcriptional regulator [Ornithinibacillus halotolerans]